MRTPTVLAGTITIVLGLALVAFVGPQAEVPTVEWVRLVANNRERFGEFSLANSTAHSYFYTALEIGAPDVQVQVEDRCTWHTGQPVPLGQ